MEKIKTKKGLMINIRRKNFITLILILIFLFASTVVSIANLYVSNYELRLKKDYIEELQADITSLTEETTYLQTLISD